MSILPGIEKADSKVTCPSAGNKRRFAWIIFPLLGIGSLVWFLVRVIPKPGRAAYPCMRVAAPMASTFVLWLIGLGSSFLFIKKARVFAYQSRYIIAAACIAAAGIIGGTFFSLSHSRVDAAAMVNAPIGDAKGAVPGRVVWVHDSTATNWAGLGDGHWWKSTHTSQAVVDRMMSRSLCALSNQTSDTAAWDTLFRYYNVTHGRGNNRYTSGEKIVIKTNFVGFVYSPVYCSVDTSTYSLYKKYDYMNNSPQGVRALLRQLIYVVGVNQADISVGDPSAYYPNEFYDSCHAEFPNVHYMDHLGKFGRTRVDLSTVPVYWSSRPVGVLQDYVPQLFAEATYLINLASMKSHAGAGVTACTKNHFGSFGRLPADSGYFDLHTSLAYVLPQSGQYRDLVDIMGHAHLGGKTMLYIVDGLYSGNHNYDSVPHRWNAAPFNGRWTASFFASQDPVAIESVLFDLFQLDEDSYQFPKMEGVTDYLVEAAQADAPASGTFYDPNHATPTERLKSLGVFEHWNDAVDRKYSRNLGTGKGIELVFIDGTASRIRTLPAASAPSQGYALRSLPMSGAVRISLPKNDWVVLTIFDARGRVSGTLVDKFMVAGGYQVDVGPGAFLTGRPATGMYVAVLSSKENGRLKRLATCPFVLTR